VVTFEQGLPGQALSKQVAATAALCGHFMQESNLGLTEALSTKQQTPLCVPSHPAQVYSFFTVFHF